VARPSPPGLDLPDLDITSLAKGYGYRTAQADTADDIRAQFKLAVEADGPTVIVVRTQPQDAKLG
jgi:benzoylformate decarboxylase